MVARSGADSPTYINCFLFLLLIFAGPVDFTAFGEEFFDVLCVKVRMEGGRKGGMEGGRDNGLCFYLNI